MHVLLPICLFARACGVHASYLIRSDIRHIQHNGTQKLSTVQIHLQISIASSSLSSAAYLEHIKPIMHLLEIINAPWTGHPRVL